jgi:hypothetical protein
LPDDLAQIRPWQRWMFQVLYRRISAGGSQQA